MRGGEIERLIITPCDEKKNVTGAPYEVMFNPKTYSHSRTIEYNCDTTLGKSEDERKYSKTLPRELKFDILLDGTGVIPSQKKKSVEEQIDDLNQVVHKYAGDKHEPNHVKIVWGKLLFFGRLESMKIDYTLFTPEGKPLRANVNLYLKSFLSNDEESAKANRSSPDLTHVVEIKAGDTLPRLCKKIYGDSFYHTQVARINNLVAFRDVKPGTIIIFPPLR